MKNVKLLLFLCLVCFLFSNNKSIAQLTVDKNYYANTIYIQGNKYVKNGVKKPIGFFHQNIKEEMKISPMGLKEFKKFETKRNTSLFLTGGAIALVIMANRVDNENAQLGFALGGLALALVSIPLSVQSGNHIQKAIWLRNDDALKLGSNF